MDPKLTEICQNIRNCSKCCSKHSLIENHPQPGYFGKDINEWCILFVGQNPGMSTGNENDKIIYDPAQSLENVQSAYSRMLREVPAGKFVNAIMGEIDPDWSHVAYSNIVKCPTKDNRVPNIEILENCTNYIRSQMSILKPVITVLMGRIACNEYLYSNQEDKVVVTKPDGRKFMFAQHYSYLSRTGVSIEEYCADIKKIIAELVKNRATSLADFSADKGETNTAQ